MSTSLSYFPQNLRSDIFGEGKQPFIVQEVIDQGGEPIKGEEYLGSGRITNFKFGLDLGRVFRRQNPMKYLGNFGTGWDKWSGNDVLNFIDNHDNQRTHAGDGGVLTYNEARAYKVGFGLGDKSKGHFKTDLKGFEVKL